MEDEPLNKVLDYAAGEQKSRDPNTLFREEPHFLDWSSSDLIIYAISLVLGTAVVLVAIWLFLRNWW